jgi:hypothetical protein
MALPYPSRPGSPLTPTQIAVLALRDQGSTMREIMRATGYSQSQVAGCLSMGSEGGSINMRANLRRGTMDLADALARTPGHRGTVSKFRPPLTSARLTGRYMVDRTTSDCRPIAASRGPCPCCAVRGTYPTGCQHQRPDPEWAEAGATQYA